MLARTLFQVCALALATLCSSAALAQATAAAEPSRSLAGLRGAEALRGPAIVAPVAARRFRNAEGAGVRKPEPWELVHENWALSASTFSKHGVPTIVVLVNRTGLAPEALTTLATEFRTFASSRLPGSDRALTVLVDETGAWDRAMGSPEIPSTFVLTAAGTLEAASGTPALLDGPYNFEVSRLTALREGRPLPTLPTAPAAADDLLTKEIRTLFWGNTGFRWGDLGAHLFGKGDEASLALLGSLFDQYLVKTGNWDRARALASRIPAPASLAADSPARKIAERAAAVRQSIARGYIEAVPPESNFESTLRISYVWPNYAADTEGGYRLQYSAQATIRDASGNVVRTLPEFFSIVLPGSQLNSGQMGPNDMPFGLYTLDLTTSVTFYDRTAGAEEAGGVYTQSFTVLNVPRPDGVERGSETAAPSQVAVVESVMREIAAVQQNGLAREVAADALKDIIGKDATSVFAASPALVAALKTHPTVVLDFMFPECPPCKLAMPFLNRLHEGGLPVMSVVVDFQSDRNPRYNVETAYAGFKRAVETNWGIHLNHDSVMMTSAVARTIGEAVFGPSGTLSFPTYIVVRDGKVTQVFQGGRPPVDRLLANRAGVVIGADATTAAATPSR